MAGIALLCGACVFAASMTSEANRTYFVNSVRYLAGDDTRILVDNDEANDVADMDEREAIQEIEDKLEIEMPEFYYRPQEWKLWDYNINISVSTACVEYLYGKNIILFYIDKQVDNVASKADSLHGEEVTTVTLGSGETSVLIEKIQDLQDKSPNYTAQWKIDNVTFQLTGKFALDDLIKIIENMEY